MHWMLMNTTLQNKKYWTEKYRETPTQSQQETGLQHLILVISQVDQRKKQQRNTKVNHTIEQMDLTERYRAFHPTMTENTFFSGAHQTSSKIDHILDHKACLNTKELNWSLAYNLIIVEWIKTSPAKEIAETTQIDRD